MTVIVKTPPGEEPISLDEVKLNSRIEHNDEDNLIESLIIEAREYCENYTEKPFITQTRTKFLSCFDPIVELSPNLQQVSEIRYIDQQGQSQVLPDTDYMISKSGLYGSVYPVHDKSWPSVLHKIDAIEIDFTCGFGDSGDVPNTLKRAMFLLIDHWYTNRSAVTVGVNAAETPVGVEVLLRQHRVRFF